MVETLSWLTGAAQGQECTSCGDLVPTPTTYNPDPMVEHQRWYCDGPAKSPALTVTAKPKTNLFREAIERMAERSERDWP